jgi:hypothetical protein
MGKLTKIYFRISMDGSVVLNVPESVQDIQSFVEDDIEVSPSGEVSFRHMPDSEEVDMLFMGQFDHNVFESRPATGDDLAWRPWSPGDDEDEE